MSCENKKTAEDILREWIGKTVLFPDIEPVYLNDTMNTDNQIKNYKILLYVDSTGCISCKLRLYIWIACIEELESKVDFIFYFNPKNKDQFLKYLKQENLNYPVYIDTHDSLNKLNKLPVNPMFQCFLLDKNNRVLAIGNPADNFKIWKLYKQIITDEISDKLPITIVEPEQTVIKLKDLQTSKTSEAVFRLKNTGTQPLIIQMVNASCGCTVPEWEKQPIKTGKNTEIKVRITPSERGYFDKTITINCNTEKGQILFQIKGMVDN
jgi:hypothetical protein